MVETAVVTMVAAGVVATATAAWGREGSERKWGKGRRWV